MPVYNYLPIKTIEKKEIVDMIHKNIQYLHYFELKWSPHILSKLNDFYSHARYSKVSVQKQPHHRCEVN